MTPLDDAAYAQLTELLKHHPLAAVLLPKRLLSSVPPF
jgi:hypothetical protein